MRTCSHCFLLGSDWTLLRSSSLSNPSVDSTPVSMVSLVSVQPGTCGTCPVPTTPAASAGILRDTNVLETYTDPASGSEGSVDGGGTD